MGRVPTLLAHAREAGAATVLRALEPRFRQAGWRVVVDLNSTAAAAFGGGDLPAGDLSTEGIDLVLCGYDVASRDETGMLLRQARTLGLHSLGILDAWKGVDRFWYGDGRLRPLADAICVPDRILARWMVARGAPSDAIHVVEHPMLAALRATTDDAREAARLTARRHLGLPDAGRPVLMFFSEPLRLPAGGFSSLAECSLKDGSLPLHKWLEREYGESHVLVINPHPVEPVRSLKNWRSSFGLSLHECLFLADQVVGVGSTVLAYSVACGIATRNVHPLILWNPHSSNYEPEIWQSLVEARLFDGSGGNPTRTCDVAPFGRADIVALANALLARPRRIDSQ